MSTLALPPAEDRVARRRARPDPRRRPDLPVAYHQLLRGPGWRWWRPLVSLAVLIGLLLVLFVAVFGGFEGLDALLPDDVFAREPLPWAAGFLAGKVFLTYRRRGGARRSPLPDFYIGAHAAVRGYRLLTRDRARYATYFPTLDLIAPAAT